MLIDFHRKFTCMHLIISNYFNINNNVIVIKTRNIIYIEVMLNDNSS
jgi:hypothetical protein